MTIPATCLRCDEPVGPDGRLVPYFGVDGATMRLIHRVCEIRSRVGGLNHLLGRCTCCGGTEEPDPPGLSRYQAAVAAVQYWMNRQCFEPNRGD